MSVAIGVRSISGYRSTPDAKKDCVYRRHHRSICPQKQLAPMTARHDKTPASTCEWHTSTCLRATAQQFPHYQWQTINSQALVGCRWHKKQWSGKSREDIAVLVSFYLWIIQWKEGGRRGRRVLNGARMLGPNHCLIVQHSMRKGWQLYAEDQPTLLAVVKLLQHNRSNFAADYNMSICASSQHSTAQHSTAQHSTALHSTAQHSTAWAALY